MLFKCKWYSNSDISTSSTIVEFRWVELSLLLLLLEFWLVASMHRTINRLLHENLSWSNNLFFIKDEANPTLSVDAECQASQYVSTALSPKVRDPCHTIFCGLKKFLVLISWKLKEGKADSYHWKSVITFLPLKLKILGVGWAKKAPSPLNMSFQELNKTSP